MTQELQPTTANTPVIPLGAAEYFVALDTPFRWSSGPLVLTSDPDNDWTPFASLAAAKAYAESQHHPSYAEDAVEASYGVRYTTKLDRNPRTYQPPTEQPVPPISSTT